MESRVRTEPNSLNRHERPDLAEIIKHRRATNHFTDGEVSDQDLENILYYAGQAPSGYNLQPWRFLVVREAENKQRLQKAAFDQEKISEASVVLIFLGMPQETQDRARSVFEEGNRRGLGKPENLEQNLNGALEFIYSTYGWKLWVHRHTMIAFSFAMIMAEWLGYDTAPMEGFDAAAVKREFEIPQEAEVVALLAIGRAKDPDKKYPGRFPLEQVAFCEKYGDNWK